MDASIVATTPLSFMLPVEEAPTQEGAARGAEDVDRSTISIPRVVVVQKTSTAFEDAQYGELWNTLTEQLVWPLPGMHDDTDIWGPLAKIAAPVTFKTSANQALNGGKSLIPLLFVPVLIYRDRSLFVDSQLRCASARGGTHTRREFLSPATDEDSCVTCPLRLWKEKALEQYEDLSSEVEGMWRGDSPPCNENICVMALIPDLTTGDAQGAVIQFSKTSFAAGRKLEAWLSLSSRDAWARMYGLYSTEEVNADKQSYASLRVRQIPGFTPPAFVQMAEEAYSTVQVD